MPLKPILSTIAMAVALSSSPFAARSVLAQTFCSEPLEPVCFDTPPDMGNELQVTRCLQDADAFEVAVEEYTTCVEENLATWRQEASTALTDIRCALENPDDADCPAGGTTADSSD